MRAWGWRAGPKGTRATGPTPLLRAIPCAFLASKISNTTPATARMPSDAEAIQSRAEACLDRRRASQTTGAIDIFALTGLATVKQPAVCVMANQRKWTPLVRRHSILVCRAEPSEHRAWRVPDGSQWRHGCKPFVWYGNIRPDGWLITERCYKQQGMLPRRKAEIGCRIAKRKLALDRGHEPDAPGVDLCRQISPEGCWLLAQEEETIAATKSRWSGFGFASLRLQ